MNLSQYEIARRTGLSRSTVSRALSNHPAISETTRRKVKEVAEKLGYKKNPLVSMLVAQLRSTKTKSIQQSLTYISDQPPEACDVSVRSTNARYYQGVVKRADQLGYTVDLIYRLQQGMTGQKLQRILRARGVRGILISPRQVPLGHLSLNWKQYAVVSLVNPLPSLAVHYVSPFSFNNLGLALRVLCKYGYRRIGYAISNRTDQWANLAFSARYAIFCKDHPESASIPPLTDWGRDDADDIPSFERWFSSHRPEVIIHAGDSIPFFLKTLKIKPPKDVATCNLILPQGDLRQAGINQLEEAVGMAAVDLLVEQLHNNELGIPLSQKAVCVQGKWVNGLTCPSKQ